MELHLNLLESATRSTILDQIEAALTAEQIESVRAAIEAVGLPDRAQRDFEEVCETVEDLNVSDRVKADVAAVYDILAHAEAEVHQLPVKHTHFHEVGRASGVRNVVQICLAIEALAPERITSTRVQTGKGKVECAHGLMDIPAPATAAIIATGLPVCEDRFEGELLTPTSAAIIKHFVESFDE